MVGSEVLASEDGLTWRRIAGPTEDRDLRSGTPIAAAAAGPGLVAVGADNKAWYSTDGSDWALAEVPPPPGEPSPLERPLDRTQTQGTVEMQGVAVSGRNLVAWGISIWVHDDNSATFVPVVWASNDGVSWAKVDAPQWAYPKVASGPNGFAVASEEGSVWLSADGRSWERAAKDAFGSSRWPELLNDDGIRVEMQVSSLAAGVAGYIAVGTDGVCMLGCSSEETVIWTSPDGRTWSRLPDDDLFRAVAGAGADVAAARGFDFIVGGESDGKPTIWISGSEQAGNGAAASTAPAPPILTPTPGQPVDYAGTWEATDPPPDSSHLTMEVIVMADGSHEVTIRDDSASVCAGAPSTMTGVAEKGEPGMIVIAQPDFRCDDGSVAQAHSGPPLDEQLRNLGFSYDSLRDALRDSLGLEWIRAEAAP